MGMHITYMSVASVRYSLLMPLNTIVEVNNLHFKLSFSVVFTIGCQSCMLTTVDHLPYNYGQMVSALLGLISTVQLHGMIMQ